MALRQKYLGFSQSSIIVLGMNKFTQILALLTLVILSFHAPAFAQGAPAANPPAAAAPAQDGSPALDADGNPIVAKHKLYVGLLGGASRFSVFNADGHTIQFNYGAHIGIDAFNIGNFAAMAFGFHFDNTNLKGADDAGDKVAFGTTLFQAVFRSVAGSGLYFGVEGGFAVVTYGNAASDVYTYGAEVGYDIPICAHLSIAPELHYDRNGAADLTIVTLPPSNLFKAFLAINYHFE